MFLALEAHMLQRKWSDRFILNQTVPQPMRVSYELRSHPQIEDLVMVKCLWGH